MDRELIGQILGILATVLTFVSYQFNTKRSLLFIQTAATAATCLAYFFLDADSGFVLNIVCIGRNLVYYFQESGTKANRISAGALALIMAVTGAFSWQGWYSLLIIVALAINTLVLSLGDAQILRKSILLTSGMILIYNIIVFSLGGILNEGVAIASSVIGILRFRKSLAQNKTI